MPILILFPTDAQNNVAYGAISPSIVPLGVGLAGSHPPRRQAQFRPLRGMMKTKDTMASMLWLAISTATE